MRKITILGLLIVFASFTFGQVKSIPGFNAAAKAEKMVKGTGSHHHSNASKATFLNEDFSNFVTTEPALPTGWTTQKVDANTIASTTYQGGALPQFLLDAYANGWSCTIHINGESNDFVTSNSHFTSPSPADRWLFTPAITISSACVLTWKGRSINFGLAAASGETYEVYVTNSIAGSAPRASDFPTSTRVYTTGAGTEATAWTLHTANITWTTGTVYVAFRHTSTNKQVLAIDDVRVGSSIQNDLEKVETYLWNNWLGYTGLTPKKQWDTVYFGMKYKNVGLATQHNCQVQVKVNNGSTDVFTGTTTPTASLAPDAIDSLVLGTFFVPPASPVDYVVAYNASQTEAEETPITNKDTLDFSITDSSYSRPMYYSATTDITMWEAQASPITGGSGIMIGCNYFFNVDDTINKLTISVYNGTTAGVLLTGKIFLVDQSTGDRTEVATSAAFVTTAITGATAPQLIDLALVTPYPVSAGAWVSAVVEVTYSTGSELTYLTDTKSPNEYGSIFYFPTSSSWYWITNEFPHVSITTGHGAVVPHGVANNNGSMFSIYPNPANNSLTLNLKNNQTSLVEVYNMLGAVVTSFNSSSLTNNIDISNLNAGIYTLKVSQNGQSTTQKFVKQ